MFRHQTRLTVAALAISAMSLVACAVPRAHLNEPLITDRPDFTESAESVEPGHTQLETGHTFSRVGDERSTSVGEVLVRSGLTSRTELRVGLNSYTFTQTPGTKWTRGLEDGSIGAKVRLLGGGETGSWKPNISLIGATSVPTGAQPYRSKAMQPEAKLILGWTLNDRVAFSSNLNVGGVKDLSWHTEYSVTGSFGIGITDRIGMYAEGYSFFTDEPNGSAQPYVNAGTTYQFTPDVQLDLRAGTGVRRSYSGPNYFVGVGLSRRW